MSENLTDKRRQKRAVQLVSEFDKDIRALPGICRRIERAFFDTKEDWAKKSSLISAKYKLEEMMRCADELSWLAGDEDPADYPARITQPTENYSVTGDRASGFTVTMPPLQKRDYEKKLHPQKVKAESVRAAVLIHLKKLGLRKCIYDRCTLTYTVMIGPEAGGNIGDSDNLDTKQITDALTGIFYRDDDLTHVQLTIRGELTDGPSYTKLEIERWGDMTKDGWMFEGTGRFWTVFPLDEGEMPQDFPSWLEAKDYGDETFGEGNYTIEEAITS